MLRMTFISLGIILGWMMLHAQPIPKYELRGLWIATVKNIDWPSKPGLSSDEQQREAIAIIEKAVELNLNTLFLQVRPSSDAFYPSALEPFSVYLTGDINQTPDYDPLKFWIDEAHKRGLELHAWINPFRASMALDEPMSDKHPVKQHPDWFIAYAGKWQYDAGNPACREHIGAVVDELITNYAIDGIHMDDYFYPYPKAGEIFNDSASFATYNTDGYTKDQIADWRRSNVDKAIELIHNLIQNKKPEMEFGISPFGVWRNKADDNRGSETKAGVTNYDDLYADILKWMKNDWIDYVVPQIYWDFNHPTANYKVLADWWNQNSYDKSVLIGHALYRVNSDAGAWQDPNEIINQINYGRLKSNVYGSVFFSAHHLMRDLKGLQDSLTNTTYHYPALIPIMSRTIESTDTDQPIKIHKCGKYLKCKTKNNTFIPTRYVVYAYSYPTSNPENDAKNIYCITASNKIKPLRDNINGKRLFFKVSAIDHNNKERCLSYPRQLIFK